MSDDADVGSADTEYVTTSDLIEIKLGNGDCAEAETCEGAKLAARTLWDEADWRGSRPSVTFTFADGTGFTISDRKALS